MADITAITGGSPKRRRYVLAFHSGWPGHLGEGPAVRRRRESPGGGAALLAAPRRRASGSSTFLAAPSRFT